MKTVYYLVGPTASGKTTVAKTLARKMGVPVYHADLIYNGLQQEYAVPVHPVELLRAGNRESSPQDFGIEAWGEHSTLQDAKLPIIDRLIDRKDGDFVIEGYTLGFPAERAAIERVVGPHRAVILRINLPYEQWAAMFKGKKKGRTEAPLLPAYRRSCDTFAARDGDTVYTFRDLASIPVHYADYQRPGFTDKKIDALQIPITPGDVVNDIGCNAGQIGRWCLDQGATLVRGYESNWRFLDRAVQRGLEPHLGNVENDTMLPADVIVCASVFHYFRNPRGFLDKARASTRRVFVIELPILKSNGLLSRYRPKGRATDYSAKLIEFWLNERFPQVVCMGESVPPDNSYRLVYHCHV